MNFYDFLSEDLEFIENRSSLSLDDYEVCRDDFTIEGRIYDQALEPVLKGVRTATSSNLVSVSGILDEIEKEEDQLSFQTFNVIENAVIEGFKQKTKLSIQVFANKELTIFNIVSIPTEFVFPYTQKHEELFPDLYDELGSLCRMIMLEDDSNLADDAINLKYSLQKFFEQVE